MRPPPWDSEAIEDDRLRLIFTCCHPALAPDAQVALTLREVCGLTTEEIAQAFLSAAPTLAQRIVRAKAKIRDARIPYQVPEPDELAERLDSVLRVIYLVFNEGYSASSGQSLTRVDLSGEAIRLGRLLVELLPEPEAIGLLALMLLQESRRAARASPAGELILLNDQDRSLWNRDQIAEGSALVTRSLASRRVGSLRAPGGDRGGPCRCGQRRRDRLGRDRRPLRRPARRRAVAGGRAEPRGRDRDARRSGGGSRAHRRHPCPRRPEGLPPGPCRARRPVPATGQDRRGARCRTSARSRLPARSPSAGSSSGGWPSCPTEPTADRGAIEGVRTSFCALNPVVCRFRACLFD